MTRETIPEMSARHRQEIISAITECAQRRITQTQAGFKPKTFGGNT